MIKIHKYTCPIYSHVRMMIHVYKKGKHIASSPRFDCFDMRTIKMYAKGHKDVEMVNVKSVQDLEIKFLEV